MKDRENGQVALLFLLVGYLVLGTTMMWFIISGISGESVNYVNIPAQGYTNVTSTINFTATVPGDLYITSTNALFFNSWEKTAVGMVSKPLPFFPAYLFIKGIVTQDGYYKNIYYINNTNKDRFGIVIDSSQNDGAHTYWLEFGPGTISVNSPNPEEFPTNQYSGDDYTAFTSIIIETWYNPDTHNLMVFIDSENPETGGLVQDQLLSWSFPAFDPSIMTTGLELDKPPIYHGGIVGTEEGQVLYRMDTRSVVTYDPNTDIVGQTYNFATFMFQLVTFTVPNDIFPPPFVSILIPALFFYVPLLGILACIVNILWPVV